MLMREPRGVAHQQRGRYERAALLLGDQCVCQIYWLVREGAMRVPYRNIYRYQIIGLHLRSGLILAQRITCGHGITSGCFQQNFQFAGCMFWETVCKICACEAA